MSQQVADLHTKKVPATFINGDLGPQEKRIRYQLLRDGAIKFLYCTPERFDPGMVREAEVEEIARARPAYLVIDEAHCIDRWGKDFRPNYGKLGAVRKALGNPPLLAFTATAGRESQRRILESLGIPEARVVVTGVNRPNIKLMRLDGVNDEARYRLIMALLTDRPSGRAMLFVPTVRTGTQLQDGLRWRGLEVPFFHSKLGSANDRDNLLDRFTGRIDPPANVIICTNAFGMGLDLPDVRLVVHWQHPASIEDYLQEFGRAGRKGNPSIAVLFTGAKDEELLRFMAKKTVESADVDPASKSGVLAAKLGAIEEMRKAATARDTCFRRAIIAYFGDVLSPQRRSLAVQIVDSLFSRSVRTRGTRLCCDSCDGVGVDGVLAWAAQVFALAARCYGWQRCWLTTACSCRSAARLAQALLESLEEPDAELDLAWSTEVQRRYAELKSGAVEAVPAEVAFARARARLNESR